MSAISQELEALSGALGASMHEVTAAARESQQQIEALSAGQAAGARRTAELDERLRDLEDVSRRAQRALG